MGFRDNLQHLRATRNMTQEQLAMLLGVSRQSVSKWEAERAYPEMDKLLRLCDLFECTIDDLVSGDLTARPSNAAASMPSGKTRQDVTGYDEAMRAYAWKMPLGVATMVAGIALALFLAGLELVPGVSTWNYAPAAVFIGVAVGLALIVPASFERGGFRKEHPFIEDFYTADQKSKARTTMSTGLVAGIGLVMAGSVAAIALQTVGWFAGAAFFLCAAAGVFMILRGCLLGSRCDVETYNRKALSVMDDGQIDAIDDEAMQARARQAKRDRKTYGAIMALATAVGLLLLFVPVSAVQRFFWLAWPIGGILCGVVKVFRSNRFDS